MIGAGGVATGGGVSTFHAGMWCSSSSGVFSRVAYRDRDRHENTISARSVAHRDSRRGLRTRHAGRPAAEEPCVVSGVVGGAAKTATLTPAHSSAICLVERVHVSTSTLSKPPSRVVTVH